MELWVPGDLSYALSTCCSCALGGMSEKECGLFAKYSSYLMSTTCLTLGGIFLGNIKAHLKLKES